MKLIELVNNVNCALSAANKQLEEEGHKAISFRDLQTLVLISAHGINGPSNLARLSGVTSAAITVAVNVLEIKTLAIREHASHDRRVVPVKLTSLGIRVLAAASDAF